MTNIPNETERLTGRTAVDPSGDKIGTIADVYVDDDTNEPEWLAISTGLSGSKVSFAPLRGAEFAGDDVIVAYPKSLVKDAPKAEADGPSARKKKPNCTPTTAARPATAAAGRATASATARIGSTPRLGTTPPERTPTTR